MLLVISGLGLAFTEPVAKALVDLFGGGQGDWDPRETQLVGLYHMLQLLVVDLVR